MGIASGITSAIGSKKSASALKKGFIQARNEYINTYNDQQSMLSPWTQSEKSALTRFLAESQAGGRLDPMTQFRMEDYYNSPEYQIYQEAQNAASQQAMDQMKALGAAGRYGGLGGGTFANALTQNLGQLYAQYGPQALAASRQAWENQRANAFNALYGLSRPEQTNVLANYRGIMGENVAGTYTGQAAAKAQGIQGYYKGLGEAYSVAEQMGMKYLGSKFPWMNT